MSENEECTAADYEQAVKAIDDIMEKYDCKIRNKLVSHVLSMWLTVRSNIQDGPFELLKDMHIHDNASDVLDDPIHTLDRIVASIKPKVPRSGILSSQTLVKPKVEEEDLLNASTVEIDCFLYDDEDLDTFEDSGDLSRYYCGSCGSREVKFANIVSESMSRDELFHLFNDSLPLLDNKTIVDVGSGLGAVLYGAYVFTDAKKIIGVEMNKDLYDIQRDAIEEFKMNDRIEVINKKIQDVPDVLKSADVVVMNNIFNSYLPEEKHPELWNFFKEHIKPGALLVCQPSIEHAVKNLNVNFDVNKWVERITNNTDKPENELPKEDFRRGILPRYKVL